MKVVEGQVLNPGLYQARTNVKHDAYACYVKPRSRVLLTPVNITSLASELPRQYLTI